MLCPGWRQAGLPGSPQLLGMLCPGWRQAGMPGSPQLLGMLCPGWKHARMPGSPQLLGMLCTGWRQARMPGSPQPLGMLCPGWRQARMPGSPQLLSGSPYLMIVRGWLIHSPWPCHSSGTDLLRSRVAAVPTFSAPLKDNFLPNTRAGRWDGFRMIQVHYIHGALYFYCYCISSSSDH